MEFDIGYKHLLCIDSDGCAVNTMTVKHERFFGPYILEVWGLKEYEDEILKQWNSINLYSLDRGINRFKGLLKMLEIIIDNNFSAKPIADISVYRNWVTRAEVLSNESLKAASIKSGDECMRLAYAWSTKVNASVAEYENPDLTFDYVRETLEKASTMVDIIVVSSANKKAILKEWKEAGLHQYVKFFAGQEDGTKTECIQRAMKNGYDQERVMMIGDSPGDRQSAIESSVKFYPIVPTYESDAWRLFCDEILEIFIKGQYSEAIQLIFENKFFQVLGGNDYE